MKTLLSILLMATVFTTNAQSIHSFTVKSIDGKNLNLASFKGKKILIVNTASKCGYTPQYEGLEKVYEQYKDKLVILGFPCNQFGGQEPGTNEEIVAFCKKNYGVSFPLADKIEVKGDNIAPIYQWLTMKSKNGILDASIGWNFNKFLIDENGKMIIQGVDYGRITPVLVKAIQEQDKKINQLKKEKESLEKTLQLIQRRLLKLEKKK
jgi:glutathione peroxidase